MATPVGERRKRVVDKVGYAGSLKVRGCGFVGAFDAVNHFLLFQCLVDCYETLGRLNLPSLMKNP